MGALPGGGVRVAAAARFHPRAAATERRGERRRLLIRKRVSASADPGALDLDGNSVDSPHVHGDAVLRGDTVEHEADEHSLTQERVEIEVNQRPIVARCNGPKLLPRHTVDA